MAGNDARRLVTALFLSVSCCAAAAPDAARIFADKIADRYGAAGFPKVESIHFNFHVMHAGKEKIREWTWFPKSDSVAYRGEDAKGLTLTAEYSRRNKYSMASETIAGIDKSFVNDQYWFLFPLHLRWDKEISLSLAPGGALSVRYPKQGGYTPGDMYELMASEDGTITKWMFHRSGADTVTMQADWEAPKVVDGLPVSLDRPGKNGFKVWFTAVKVAGLKP